MGKQKSPLLVVDDNEGNRDIMSRQLRRQGFDVLTAENGERALEIVATEPIDLVILDIMMPGMDGVEVLRRLRREHSPAQLPIIMATAKTDSQDIVECAELGANDHIGKPLDFDVIVAKVRALLRLKALTAPPSPPDGEPTVDELRPGAVLDGRYRIEEGIGEGTFGTVYRARHLELDLEVAIKVLQPRLTRDDSLRRFRQEGIAACRVRHPNAVNVSDFGVTETGVAFLAMELLEGVSLDEELESRGRLSPRRANEILQPICEVLAEAASMDLVHRDIKPQNIFLHRTTAGEVVKVLDFGIAKLVGQAAIRENLTVDGWFVGTPAYAAPERISLRDYDGRADVYSLGVMAFEMLTGRRPFLAVNDNPMSVITQHADRAPPTLRSVDPDLPEALEGPVARALVKDPEERPDAKTFGAELARSVETIAEPRAPAKVARPGPTDTDATRTVSRDLRESGPLGRWLKKLKTP